MIDIYSFPLIIKPSLFVFFILNHDGLFGFSPIHLFLANLENNYFFSLYILPNS